MLEISGSYVLSAIIILAVGRFWQTNSEAKKALYLAIDDLKNDIAEKDKRIAILENEHSATQNTLKEIKDDVKFIREKLLRAT